MSLIITEMQIKVTTRYPLTPVRMATTSTSTNKKCQQHAEKRERSCSVGGNVERAGSLGSHSMGRPGQGSGHGEGHRLALALSPTGRCSVRTHLPLRPKGTPLLVEFLEKHLPQLFAWMRPCLRLSSSHPVTATALSPCCCCPAATLRRAF